MDLYSACFSGLQTNAKGFRDPTDFRISAHLVEEQNAEFWGLVQLLNSFGVQQSAVATGNVVSLSQQQVKQGRLSCLHDVLGGIIGGFHVPASNQRGRMKINI